MPHRSLALSLGRLPARYETSFVSAEQIRGSFESEWRQLIARSVEENAFLSPDFLLPAISRIVDPSNLVIVAVRDRGAHLIGLGFFEEVPSTRVVPFPHVRALKSIHTFRSGLLIDRDHIQAGIHGILHALYEKSYWGIWFSEQWLDSPLVGAIQRVAETSKFEWRESVDYLRPSFTPSRVTDAYLDAFWSRSRRKSVAKNRRRIEALGRTHFRITSAGADFASSIERFLELEHSGWKGNQGTSLRSCPDEEVFFREMMSRFAAYDRAFFAELVVDDVVIASTANFTAGDTAFAFKVGWDENFAHASPGKYLDTELMLHMGKQFPHIASVDSCARGVSYLSSLWPERIRIGDGMLTLKRRSRIVSELFDRSKQVKRQLQSRFTF